MTAPRIEGIVGQTGNGKSTLAKERIELPEYRRAIILEQTDAKSEYPGTLRVRDGVELRALFRRLGAKRYTIPFRVALAPAVREFPMICGLVKHLGHTKLVIEEFGRYYGNGVRYPGPIAFDPLASAKFGRPFYKQTWLPLPHEFVDLIERGRHSGPDAVSPSGILWLSQRALRCPTVLRAETKRLAAFRQSLKSDREYLADFPGASPELAERAKDLPPYHYIEFNEDGTHATKTTKPPRA